MILLFVFYELSYDNYHEKADQVYRLAIRAQIGDSKINQTYSSARNLKELRERCPEIEDAVKFVRLNNVMLKIENERHLEPSFLAADSSLFDIMTYKFLHGSKESALNNPNTIVLTRGAAEKYFGKTDVLGEQVEFDLPWGYGTMSFDVTAVIENIPGNSHLHFDHVVSMVTFPNMINNNGWSANNFQTYLKLHQGTDPDQLQAKFDDYVKEYMGERFEGFQAAGGYWDFFLQPLKSIHLNSDLNGEFEQNGNKKYVYIFSVIALFVLIIACINFMNLSTAKSALRAREVGIRKISGSTRIMLIRQFLIEAVILSFIAMTLAVILTELCLPAFSNLIGKQLSLPLWDSLHWWPILIVAGLLIGILSGIYPAFFMSKFKPITVLKGKFDSGKKGIGFRNTLVVIQFAASIFLIIGTVVIQRQISFIQTTDIGFEKEDVVVLQLSSGFDSFKEAYKEEILAHADIISVTGSSGLPGDNFSNVGFNSPTVTNSFALNLYTCDADYLKVMKMQMADGRFFSESFSTDTASVVLNQSAVKALNLENPLGTMIRTNGENAPEYTVIGVIKDYHYESMHSEIRPMGLFLQGSPVTRPLVALGIRTSSGSNQKAIKILETAWEKLVPEMPFVYSYLEDRYTKLYNNENLTRKIFSVLSLLAIIVASLGLFGLASFIAENRRKEVGIRKVMGASVRRIIILLTTKFSVWIGIAFIIAAPTAWWVMTQWLQGFVYKQDLSIWIFLVAGGLALIIALITISTITWKAATRNPIECLRYE